MTAPMLTISVKNLIAMAKVLFIDRSGHIKNLDEEMHINDEDIELILEKKDRL